ncbi:hypothetical protein C8R42DRAFT_725129 [Lentinula raphanica]|nr:hypothetical protein C8R42DRAFT_725129 [Lentinula raphanica]
MQKARDGKLKNEYEAKKKASLLQSMWKLRRRLKICDIMAKHNQDDAHAVAFWNNMLEALSHLDVAGMSDDEDSVDADGHRVLKVLSPQWRHPKFEQFFDQVDRMPATQAKLFPGIGRPRIPRMRGEETVQRIPPPSLPTAYFRDGYRTS